MAAYPLATSSGPSSLLSPPHPLSHPNISPSLCERYHHVLRSPLSSQAIKPHSMTPHHLQHPPQAPPLPDPLLVWSLVAPMLHVIYPGRFGASGGWVRGWGCGRWRARRRSWGWPLAGSAGARTGKWSGSGCATGGTPERCSTSYASKPCKAGSSTDRHAGRRNRRRCWGLSLWGICNSNDSVSNYISMISLLLTIDRTVGNLWELL